MLKPTLYLSILIALFASLLGQPVSAQGSQAVSVTISAPASVVYGHRPYQLVTTVFNNTSVDQPFDVTTSTAGAAWAPESYTLNLSTGSIIRLVCGGYCSYRWVGTVPANSVATFSLTVYSGFGLGAYPAGTVYLADTTEVLATAMTTLVQGEEPPSGELTLSVPYWFPGQMNNMTLTVNAPIATTFTVNTTTTCGSINLPGVMVSDRWRTTFEFYYSTLSMPESTSGNCSITAHVSTPDDGSWDVTLPITVPTLVSGFTVPSTAHTGKKFAVNWSMSTDGLFSGSMYIMLPEGLRIKSRESCYYLGCSLYADIQGFTGTLENTTYLQALTPGTYTITYVLAGTNITRIFTQTVEVTK